MPNWKEKARAGRPQPQDTSPRPAPLPWERVNTLLDRAAGVLNNATPAAVSGPLRAGVDLGTADVVLLVLDQAGSPAAAFLEWAQVVRDGVVFDFTGAVNILRRLLGKARARLGRDIAAAATSFPPGTDPRLSVNTLERAGLTVTAAADEPTCVANLLRLDRTAVVDIGGGTTGTAVIRKGEAVFSGDEPTGGRHISLAIAGHFGIPFPEAEEMKIRGDRPGLLELATPTLLRICDIVAGHIRGRDVEQIVLSGGSCCLPGMDQVLAQELGLPVLLPSQPLLLTPLAIAAQG